MSFAEVEVEANVEEEAETIAETEAEAADEEEFEEAGDGGIQGSGGCADVGKRIEDIEKSYVLERGWGNRRLEMVEAGI